jgi:hypothetical protein
MVSAGIFLSLHKFEGLASIFSSFARGEKTGMMCLEHLFSLSERASCLAR